MIDCELEHWQMREIAKPYEVKVIKYTPQERRGFWTGFLWASLVALAIWAGRVFVRLFL